MTPETIKFVALADYGSLADTHEAALLDLVATDFVNMPLTDRWCPMEVVELVSHCPGDIGYLPSLAIVMLDALRNKDEYGAIAFRWAQNHPYIRALPDHQSAPLLAAVRYLYEDGDLESLFFSSYAIPAEGLLPFPAP